MRNRVAFVENIKFIKDFLLQGRTIERCVPFISLAVVLVVNFQLLLSFFFAEDFLHFYHISNWRPLEFIFYPYGSHPYYLRNLIFYSIFKLFGVNSVPYFTIVLITHLGSAYILYKIIHLLTNKPLIAAAGMMIWGISPVNYATLAWFTTYGQVLVGLFFLLFLYDLLRLERGIIIVSTKIIIRISIYLLLMATSFGTGLAIACLAPVAVVIVLWKSDIKWKVATSLLPVVAVILLLFIFRNSIYYYFSGEIYTSGPVVLEVALKDYYNVISDMFLKMFVYSVYCMAAFPMLFFIRTMNSNLSIIIIVLPTVITAILYIVLFFCSKEQTRRHYTLLGMLLFGLTGIIAYGRAPFYAIRNISITMASTEPRYHYVASIIVVIIIALMAHQLSNIFPKITKKIAICVFILIALSVSPTINLAPKIYFLNTSKKAKQIYYETIRNIEIAIKARPQGSHVFINNSMDDPIPQLFLRPSATKFPRKAAIFSIHYPSNTVEGRKIYFVENNCLVAEKNIEKINWRISSLIVSACSLNKTEINNLQ